MTARRRSHWGWGHADRFPARESRMVLGEQLGGLIGFGPRGAPVEPVPLEQAEIPPARLTPPETLAAFCSTEPEARAARTYGRSWCDQVRGFQGDFGAAPDLVARPRSESEVEAVLAWCSAQGYACIPFGGGTSVVGGVEIDAREAWPGVVSLDLGALDRVLEVDPVSRAACIQAGALGPDIEAALGRDRLTLRHFPQSFEFSTLGGWLATRAGGHYATHYTHIDDLTESVRMITPAGRLETARLPADGAGIRPDALILGSEGALGVITEAWVRVRPRPRWRSSVSVHFAQLEDAVAATRAIAQSGLDPANCRLLDAREAALNFVTDDGSHVLLLGFESSEHPTDPWMHAALSLIAEHGGRCPSEPKHRDARTGEDVRDPTGGAWRAAFVEAPYLQSTLISLGVMVDTFETACTWEAFPRLHARVTAAVEEALQRVCGLGRVTCRFTHVYPDGPAPYFTFIAPFRLRSGPTQWAEVKAAAMEAILAAGGAVTHHHAVGRTHLPWHQRQRGPVFGRVMASVKQTLDPGGIMNPGVLI